MLHDDDRIYLYTYMNVDKWRRILEKPNRWGDWLILTNFITNAGNNNLQRNLLGAMYVSNHHYSHVDRIAHSYSHFLIYSFSFFHSLFFSTCSSASIRDTMFIFFVPSLSLSAFSLAGRTHIEQHMQTYAAIY